MAETKIKTPAKPRRKNLSAPQKAEAIALWKSGSVTLDDLASKYKKDRKTMLSMLNAAGAAKGEDAAVTTKAVTEKVKEDILTDATVVAKRIRDTKHQHYGYAQGITNLTWQLLVKVQQGGHTMSSISNDLKSLQTAMTIFKLGREERYAALGMDKHDDNTDIPMPELVVTELTAEDIRTMHQEQMVQHEGELGLLSPGLLGDETLITQVIAEEEHGGRVETE